LGLAGCKNLEWSIFGADRANPAAPRQVIDAALDGVDLIGLLVPDRNDQAELSRRVRERTGERRSPVSGIVSGRVSGAMTGGVDGRVTTDWSNNVKVEVSGSVPGSGQGQIVGIIRRDGAGANKTDMVDGYFTALVTLSASFVGAPKSSQASGALPAPFGADLDPRNPGAPMFASGEWPGVAYQQVSEAFVAAEITGGVIGQFAGIIKRKADGSVEGMLTGSLFSEPTRASVISGVTPEDMRARHELAVAYEIFERRVREAPPAIPGMSIEMYQIKRRDDIQDEILRASEQRCAIYKTYLTRTQSGVGFFGGALTTILGGLGAIFTPASTARALSGAAGITSGVTAEFEEAFFRSLTMETIVEGIEERRSSIYNEIIRRRSGVSDQTERRELSERPGQANLPSIPAVPNQAGAPPGSGAADRPGAQAPRPLSLAQYSIERAIHDAIRYHQTCSMIEGIRAAGDAVRNIRHPGPELVKHAVNQAGAIRQALNDAVAGTTSSAAVTAAEVRQIRGISNVPIAVPLEEIERSPLIALADAEREAAQLDADLQVLAAATRASVAEAKRRAPQTDTSLTTSLENIETGVTNLIGAFRGLVTEYSRKIQTLRGKATTKPNDGDSLTDKLAKARSNLEAASRESESVRAQKRAEYDLIVNQVRDDLGEPARRNRDLLVEATERTRVALAQVRDGAGGTSQSITSMKSVLEGVEKYIGADNQNGIRKKLE
jgi:hypothetical protein